MLTQHQVVTNKGFSLVELVIFIVVIGIVSVAMIIPLTHTAQNSINPLYQTVAYELAQERTEILLGQRYLKGFNSFTDICNGASPPAICTPLTGYAINTPNVSVVGSSKQIVVTVTRTGSSTVLASITTQVESY